ncbi:MAG: amino acid adenylation domain-containing protein [Candidatus Binatia bacterium]
MIREGFVFPLSFAQQRLWFIEQLEPGTGTYNLPVAYRLRGPINLLALQQSLNEIVRRHEVLRTTFSFMDGDSVQMIVPALALRVRHVDLRHLSPAQVTEFVSRESRAPFDLSRGPLMRASLLQLSQEDHILLIVLHLIISDGWSIGVLLRELSVFYESCLQETPAALPDLPVQYADFAVWQREWLEGALLQTQLSYWKEKLQKPPAVLELPADRRRPATQTYSGARRSLFLSKTISDALKALGRREGATLFMVMLSAFKILLFRYTGQIDIVVGTPIAGRNRAELEALIGFFLNMLVLRTDLSGNPSFTELLKRVREVALGAYANQEIPFEKLVEELQPQRDLSRSPFFQVMFQVRHYSKESLNLPGVRNERFEFDTGIAKFDLALDVLDKPEGMSCVFRYNVDLFDDATIGRMCEHFTALLEAIAQDPEERISAFSLLASTEEARRLGLRQPAQASKQPESRTIHGLFELQAQRMPEATAVVCEAEKLTYGELNARANRLARFLIRQGVGPETLVGICVERSIEMVVGILAILKSGAAYVPLDPEYPKARLGYIVNQSGIDRLITKERWLDHCPGFPGQTICLDRDATQFGREKEKDPSVAPDPDNLAYVIYTSGSTGKPKGVLGFHRGVVNYFSYLMQTYNLDAADVVLQVPSLSFDASIRDLLGPLAAGARIVIMNDSQAKEPAALLSYIKERGVTCILSIVPTLLNELLAVGSGGHRLNNSVRLILVSGEALSKAACLKARQVFGANTLLVNQYGPTECTLTSSYHLIDGRNGDWDIAPLGQPIPNARMCLLDNHLNLVPTGVSGEICIGGAGLTRGYLNSPDLTAERFIPDPFSVEAGSRLYKTGDIGRYRSDGKIDFLGRVDHQVKVRGFRIEPGEIEASIREHPSVKEAAVVARDDKLGNPRLAAYIVPLGTSALGHAEMARFLKERLPAYMVPSLFVFMDKIPLSPNGKIDRRALPDPVLPDPPRKLGAAPRTPLEKTVAEIWRDVLGVKDLSIDDDFFELGGHSLQATQVVSRLRGKLAVRLSLRRLFEAPTLGGLARCIEEEMSAGKVPPDPELRRLSPREGPPLHAGTRCVHQFFEAQVEQIPDEIAVAFESETLTYRELNRRANQLANHLKRSGVGPEVYVGICLPRSLNMLVAILGVLKAGGAYVPVDPAYPQERVAFMLEDAGVTMAIGERSLLTTPISHQGVTLCLDSDWAAIARESSENPPRVTNAENLAYVVYTSGSTGKPKGVAITHRSVVSFLHWAGSVFTAEDLRGVLASTSICFDLSVFELFVPLSRGGKVILVSSLLDLAALPAHNEVTLINTVPTAMFQLLGARVAPSSVRTINLGGEFVPTDLVRRIYDQTKVHRVYDLYGPSEDTVYSTFALRSPDAPATIGRPIANRQVYLLDSDLQPVPLGAPGELHMGGEGLARGYLNRPELTAEKFIPHPFSNEPGARLYRTGDLARYRADGNIEFLGRLDNQVKIRGFRVETGEIEAILDQHPGIRQSIVTAREDHPGDKQLAAYIIPEKKPPAVDDLRKYLKDKLPECMVPSAFVLMAALPLTPNGKVDRTALPVPEPSQPQFGKDFAPPRTRTEKAIAEVWMDSLRLAQISVHDNFFDLGGHSIKAMEVASKISAKMNVDFPVKLLFLHPTIAELATVLERSRAENAPAEAQEAETDNASRARIVLFKRHEPTFVEIERRPLLSLIAAGKIPPVDAAALSYLSEETLRRVGLSREAALDDWYDNLPSVNWIVETCLGRIAVVMLPRFRSELYKDKEDLVRISLEALKMSRQIGARAVSLTGLLPSATDYGRAIVEEISEPSELPVITTGHATTVTAVVLTLGKILLESGRDLAHEDVAFLGMGSIGQASLRLMLRCLPHPKKIMMCDVYGKLDWLQKIRDEIIIESKFKGSVQIAGSRRKLPPEIYDAGLIVGATNVPDLLEIESLKPGTLIVDDSAPHCFNSQHAIERFKKHEDILFSEGGALRLPDRVRRVRYLPHRVERMMDPAAPASFSKRHPYHVAGCAFSSLLLARFEKLKPTLGLIDDASCGAHYELIRQLGYEAGQLHCEDYLLPERSIENFRRRFGCR